MNITAIKKIKIIRPFTLIYCIFLASLLYSQDLTYQEWQLESDTNIRLIPKYGNVIKSKEQIESDIAFIENTMSAFDSRKEASDEMIRRGFKLLYKNDFRTAMYRFNQAYLLDPNNANIYLGYGTIYKIYKQYELSKQQYIEGLKMEPKNHRLLIDYGNTYLVEYYFQPDDMKTKDLLDSAIILLSKSYSINPENYNSSMKLSAAYLLKGNCKKALYYFNIAIAIEGYEFPEDLKLQIEDACLH